MSATITPLIKTFWTDLFAGLVSYQTHPRCATRELEVVDCMEAYGIYQGQTKCRILMDDFRECVTSTKQNHRINIMIDERDRQVADGERDPKDHYAKPPRPDSY